MRRSHLLAYAAAFTVAAVGIAFAADTVTSNYSWTKPEIGASTSTWGAKWNNNADSIDTTVKAVSNAAVAAQASADTATTLVGAAAPPKTVAMYAGGTSAPTGWALCDGGTYSLIAGGSWATPDLRNRFIVGAGSTYSLNDTGGATTVVSAGTVGGTAITQANLPNVNFSVTDNHTHTATQVAHTHTYSLLTSSTASAGGTASTAVLSGSTATGSAQPAITVNAPGGTITVASGGSGSTHTHSYTGSATSVLPPYYALVYVCKL